MIKLNNALRAWGQADFETVLKTEIENLDAALLPLQAGLTQSSYVSEEAFKVIILGVVEQAATLNIKLGVFYSGLIAGCSCADDPTTPDSQNEYCELELLLDRTSAVAAVKLLT